MFYIVTNIDEWMNELINERTTLFVYIFTYMTDALWDTSDTLSTRNETLGNI